MNSPVRDLLEAKGHGVETVFQDVSVLDAVSKMEDKGIGCLLVTSKAGKVLGLISERDCVWKVVITEKSPHKTLVKDVMTPKRKLLVISPEKTVEDCMAVMTSGRLRHLPVMENDQLVGIISIGDVVKFLLGDQQLTINQLEKYISGSM